MRGIPLYAIVAAAFVSGAFLASPELRAYAAATIGSEEIIDNSIQSVDIKDGTISGKDIATAGVLADDIAANAVGSSEIATDAVGASELKGVTRLIFKLCNFSDSEPYPPGTGSSYACNVPGARTSDRVIATNSGDGSSNCYGVANAKVSQLDFVTVSLKNNCNFGTDPKSFTIAMIVFQTS